MPRVYHIHSNDLSDEEYRAAVYVGRPSEYGNRYTIGIHGTREVCVAKFREYLMNRPELIAKVKRELRGRDLLCWCHPPKPCHGQVLLEVANEE